MIFEQDEGVIINLDQTQFKLNHERFLDVIGKTS